MVGAYSDDCAAGDDCGSAYVYRLNGTGWVEEQKLTASDADAEDWFGRSVSVSGDAAVVGAPQDACGPGNISPYCGSAYVFRFDGTDWFEEQKLTAPDAAMAAWFGWSVSVDGDTAVVGAPFVRCATGVSCGSAYVFRFDGASWIEEQRLSGLYARNGDNLGLSVHVTGRTALIGSWLDTCAIGNDCGVASVIRFNGVSWIQEQALTVSNMGRHYWSGVPISSDGDTAMVGAFADDCPGGHDCGSAYVYRFNEATWVEEQKLAATDSARDDYFGWSVSVRADTGVVAAPRDWCAAGNGCGAAYVYRFDGTHWVETRKLAASDAASHDHFGVSISLAEETAVVGALYDDSEAGPDCGAAYVFDVGPDESEVAIDVKPGSAVNRVNLGARGVVPVAVLTTSVAEGEAIDFDAAEVVAWSLTLAGAAPRAKGRSGRVASFEDVDGDGDLDLVVHFPIEELDLAPPDDACPEADGGRCPPYAVEAVLLGQTLDGTPIRGTDIISARAGRRIGAESVEGR